MVEKKKWKSQEVEDEGLVVVKALPLAPGFAYRWKLDAPSGWKWSMEYPHQRWLAQCLMCGMCSSSICWFTIWLTSSPYLLPVSFLLPRKLLCFIAGYWTKNSSVTSHGFLWRPSATQCLTNLYNQGNLMGLGWDFLTCWSIETPISQTVFYTHWLALFFSCGSCLLTIFQI